MPTTLAPWLGRRPEREAAPAAADVEDPVALAAGPACGRRSRASPPAPPRASRRRARRSRSCRSSSRRGRARRTRWRRRSGGGPRARRAPWQWRRPLGRSSAAGRRGGRVRPVGAHGAEQQRALVGAVEGGRLPAVEQGDHRVHVVDLDLAADVGAAEAELARRPQDVGGGPRRADVEGRAGAVGGLQPGPVPELDRERPLRDPGLDLAAQRGRCRRRAFAGPSLPDLLHCASPRL